MKYISKEKSDYVPIPEGAHRVVCSAFIDLGMQDAFGADKPQFLLRLEFPDSRVDRVVNGNRINEPMVKYQFYTNSLNKKANLRRDLEGILGRGLTKQELGDGFNSPVLVGQAWQVNIIHDHSSDTVKDKISSMSKLLGDTPAPLPELTPILYSRGLGVDEQWELLPSWIQEKVNQQAEDKKGPPPSTESDPIEDDDVNF